MIIAYPLEDINSITKKRTCYQQKGVPCRVVVFMNNMAILENKKGVKFPANIDKLVWSDTGP